MGQSNPDRQRIYFRKISKYQITLLYSYTYVTLYHFARTLVTYSIENLYSKVYNVDFLSLFLPARRSVNLTQPSLHDENAEGRKGLATAASAQDPGGCCLTRPEDSPLPRVSIGARMSRDNKTPASSNLAVSKLIAMRDRTRSRSRKSPAGVGRQHQGTRHTCSVPT